MKTRLNKFLSSCGLGSRRKAEEFIIRGQVRVNGTVTRTLSVTVDEELDIVEVNNKRIRPLGDHIYLLMNKPKGFITTVSDDKNRPIIMNIIPERFRKPGIFPVGRLDKDTEGLLILTNDGELAFRLSHPKYQIQKEYLAELDKPLTGPDREKIEAGLYLHQIQTRTGKARVTPAGHDGATVKLVISEGKKRQVRLTFQSLGYRVLTLTRTGYGTITLRGLKKGRCRELRKAELKSLKELVKL